MNERIKILRKNLGLTQQTFADKLGIARGNIAAYEAGKNGVSDSVVNLICRTFDVNENWLRYGDGDMFIKMTRDEQITRFLADVQLQGNRSFPHKLITALSKLTPEAWDVLADICNKIAENPDIDDLGFINDKKNNPGD